jgi:hypothetical protein
MSATVTTFKPPWALTCWIDDRYVYVELPGAMPYIERFALCDAGLSKALNILRSRRREYAGPPEKAPYVPNKPATRYVHRGRATRDAFDEDQRDRARAVLKALGPLKKKAEFDQ